MLFLSPASWKYKILICVLVAVASAIVFFQVGDHDFINYDDPAYITDNHMVRAGLTQRGFIWAFTSTAASNWHPITWLSHMLDCHFFDLDAGRHHIVNVLFHIANSLLLFLFFQRATSMTWQSGVVALLFAVHPLHVESVAWASERKDVLSTFFMFLAFHGYISFVRRPRTVSYLVVILFFILALLSKPMVVTFPFLLLLLDVWPLRRLGREHVGDNAGRRGRLQIILEKIPLLALSLLAGIITFLVQKESGAVKPLEMIPLELRIANAFVSYCLYLKNTVFPFNLSVFYPYRGDLGPWETAGAVIFLVIVTGSMPRLGKKHPHLAVGWLWYLVGLVPVIGIVQVGLQAMADRYTYVPLIGIFVMIVWSAGPLCLERPRRASVIFAPVVFVLIGAAWLQTSYWKNSATLFSRALQTTEKNYVAHHYLAQDLMREKRFTEAESHYLKALAIKPYYLEAIVNLGVVLAEQGKTDEALDHLSRALRTDPDNPGILNNIGNIYRKTGHPRDAAAHYKKAIDSDPEYREALFNLANTYEKMALFPESLHYYNRVVELYPDFAEALNGLGVALARSGKINESVRYFERAIQARPGYAQAIENLRLALTGENEETGN